MTSVKDSLREPDSLTESFTDREPRIGRVASVWAATSLAGCSCPPGR